MRTLVLVSACLLAAGCGESDSDDVGAQVPPAEAMTIPGVPQPAATAEATVDAPVIDPETVVITVNGAPITQGEVDEELAGLLFGGGMPAPQAQLARFRDRFGPQAEKRVIDRKLLELQADAEGIEATPEAIEERWKVLSERAPKGMDRKTYVESKGFTVEEVNQGITMELKLDALIKKHAPYDAVTDEDVAAFFEKHKHQIEQVRARHILLNVPPDATDEIKAQIKARIEGYRKEVAEKGLEHFQALAKEHSGCPTGQKGGDLGFFPRKKMVPAFDAVAFELEPGTVSEPVLTNFGWHILLVEERRGMEHFEEQIRGRLEQERRGAAVGVYVGKLRKAAKIERPTEAKK